MSTLSDDIAHLATQWTQHAAKLEAKRESCRDHAFALVTLLYAADNSRRDADARSPRRVAPARRGGPPSR